MSKGQRAKSEEARAKWENGGGKRWVLLLALCAWPFALWPLALCPLRLAFVMLRFYRSNCDQTPGLSNIASMSSESKSTVLYQNLDTSFVNLWGLLRKLTQDGFIGRVRVELKDYTADVFMTGSSTPLVHEIDRAAGTDTLEEAALHRLVLRARESPGRVSVFKGADEATAKSNHSGFPSEPSDAAPLLRSEEIVAPTFEIPPPLMNEPTIAEWQLAPPVAAGFADADASEALSVVPGEPNDQNEWTAMTKASGELIAAVERAVNAAGVDFAELLRSARVELADDYSFLDPTSSEFQYADSVVTLRDKPLPSSYVAGLSELLRRIVNRVAEGDRARRMRERVALELAIVARKQNDALERSGFHDQLDWIAGTRVI